MILDNELHKETSANRIPKVANAMGLQTSDYSEKLFIQNLRGKLQNILTMDNYFRQFKAGEFKLIVLDAFYRFLPPGTDENGNGPIKDVYDMIDNYAEKLECGFVLIHHASKGNQSGKSVTDVGSGAGAQSRATDTHVVLRQHEEKDVIVLDAALRSFESIEPLCLRREFPLWVPDYSLDPIALKQDRPRRGRQPKVDSDSPKPQEWTRERFAAEFVTEAPQTKAAIVAKAIDHDLTKHKAETLLNLAMGKNLVHLWKFSHNEARQFSTKPQPSLIPSDS